MGGQSYSLFSCHTRGNNQPKPRKSQHGYWTDTVGWKIFADTIISLYSWLDSYCENIIREIIIATRTVCVCVCQLPASAKFFSLRIIISMNYFANTLQWWIFHKNFASYNTCMLSLCYTSGGFKTVVRRAVNKQWSMFALQYGFSCYNIASVLR